ncbi:sirohydrochlorin cobaltochelatase [Clostridium omnivorum]|uniref:Sirohydrochlorin cobaltochelatase n=1 Tax=Clostridium omnivorum TaxID=1604902 RepID=A0ABQ5N2V2_9CLOT|nr:sirohydrochlorin cobaltochelatase [Clostridium sp. E14]GLC29542.1 sirohydrochlorin cobaltochelatase [Clostridium sp. E14]
MKKAILIVSNGTSDISAFEASIGKIEEKAKATFKEYEVFRAFSSEKIILRLKSKHNITVITPIEMLKVIENLGFEEVVIQPLYLLDGTEYGLLKEHIEEFKRKSKLNRILLGSPILIPNDERRTIDFIESIKGSLEVNKNIVAVVHGTKSLANMCYWELWHGFKSCGLSNIYVGAIEGEPSINYVLQCLKRDEVKEVLLIPFLIAAGFHAKKDLEAASPSSLKSILQREGIKVQVKHTGLGEMKEFQEFLILDLKRLINNDLMLGR